MFREKTLRKYIIVTGGGKNSDDIKWKWVKIRGVIFGTLTKNY